MQNDPRSGQPKTQRADANVDRVRTLVHPERKLGVSLMAEELNKIRETVQQIIIEDLGMRTTSSKMVTPILIDDQKQRWRHVSSDLLSNAKIFDGVITGVETWCFQYNLETKH
jgi:hypothetical protein